MILVAFRKGACQDLLLTETHFDVDWTHLERAVSINPIGKVDKQIFRLEHEIEKILDGGVVILLLGTPIE